MDELINILDEEGKFTGKTELKSYAHSIGLFHATVHIWFYTSDGKLLVQQRGENKKTFPLLWDVSVAGHVASGEQIEISALREVIEEIGLKVTEEQLEKIGVFKSIQKHSNQLIDCEFHHTYLSLLSVPLKFLKPQKEEVEALKLIPIALFSKEIKHDDTRHQYVPHEWSYYQTVIEEVRKRL
jgi:isopentenyldiphosphate isomerase